jgi:catechol 2,3-dioxygenase-like lactoylglutathione lyase family enzyme
VKLSALRLFVNDLAAAHEFYADKLGFPADGAAMDAGYCVFDAGGAVLIVEPVAADAPPEDRALVGRFVGASFVVDDIHAEYARLRALGVTFAGAPERQPWGGTLATFADPSGNQLQLVQYGA